MGSKKNGASNVCILRRDYYPESAHVRRDAETLTEAGYQVDVITLRRDGQPRWEEIDGVRVYRLRWYPKTRQLAKRESSS